MFSKPLKYFEDQLSHKHFIRIHHSYIVNLTKIESFIKGSGSYVCMSGGQKLAVSRRKAAYLNECIAKMHKII